jgi:anti-sigma regulatory factor (Ser/Thr protein kinase)
MFLGLPGTGLEMNSLTVRSELKELDLIRDFLRDNLIVFDLSEEDYFKIELALVEICTNVMRYAYPDAVGDLTVMVWVERDRFYLEIRDSGIPFDPCRIKKPRLKDLVGQRQKGGLGIFLARRLMDGFSYRREDDENILTMFKKLEAGPVEA